MENYAGVIGYPWGTETSSSRNSRGCDKKNFAPASSRTDLGRKPHRTATLVMPALSPVSTSISESPTKRHRVGSTPNDAAISSAPCGAGLIGTPARSPRISRNDTVGKKCETHTLVKSSRLLESTASGIPSPYNSASISSIPG
jgi:hypothetical protein